jgi:hypothetical protein
MDLPTVPRAGPNPSAAVGMLGVLFGRQRPLLRGSPGRLGGRHSGRAGLE